jgi:hypothetical protein
MYRQSLSDNSKYNIADIPVCTLHIVMHAISISDIYRVSVSPAAFCSGVNSALLITLKMEAVSSTETSVNIYQITWSNIPEESHL